MTEYIAGNDNSLEAKFIGPPGKGRTNYGNRLKVEETFSRYKRIIGNKFKAQDFEAQKNEAKLSLFILNKMKDIAYLKLLEWHSKIVNKDRKLFMQQSSF